MKSQLLLIMTALFSAARADAGVTVYAQNLAGFNAAASNPPVVVDFDDIAPGTDVSGQTVHGITFVRVSAPLIVVVGTNTYTPGGFSGVLNAASNKLFPTSGANVLSPGGLELGPGPNPNVEGDSMELRFANPVSAIGFDHLSQSADGYSGTSVAVYAANGTMLYSAGLPITNFNNLGGGAPGAADFWGIVSTDTNLSRVVISETDNNAAYPDCNIGLDTIRVARLSWAEIAIARVPTGVEVRFTGTLQSAPAPNGPWAVVPGATSPWLIPASSLQPVQFFRARVS